MNKQELIERIECLKNIFGNKNEYVKIDFVIELASELDEPQKVIIPQFVADWIEECEEKEKTLLNSLLYTPEGVNSWVGNSDNQELFARAWIEGYEVEKEPKYTVKIKATKHYFAKDGNGRIYFSLKYESAFTKIELEKANLDWVFDCEGIEIEEVE
nr:MAG TPA: Protein of unknown function (DUF1642) [Caudoviricetes sp.]